MGVVYAHVCGVCVCWLCVTLRGNRERWVETKVRSATLEGREVLWVCGESVGVCGVWCGVWCVVCVVCSVCGVSMCVKLCACAVCAECSVVCVWDRVCVYVCV